jgi:hypothetical protein
MIYGGYITPEEAIKGGDTRTLEELRAAQKISKKAKCLVCGQPVWRYGVGDMCFPCTTGESDASEDYELV